MTFNYRWTMYCTMSTTMMDHAYDLKGMAEVIIQQLARMIAHEYKQIDFSRVKPMPPTSLYPRGSYILPSTGNDLEYR